MRILYGTKDNNVDITKYCLEKLMQNNVITIPSGDVLRASMFSDPVFGSLKNIYIGLELENKVMEYPYYQVIKIDFNESSISVYNDRRILNHTDIYKVILYIHNKLQLEHGIFTHELPEQMMAAKYLRGNEKVLEIGANIGRNSLIISYILGENNKNMVCLESDPKSAEQLRENRDTNGFSFHIENSALSMRKLIQKDWETIPSDTLLEGYAWVNTITYEELIEKYGIVFDTLILDCEGAFYYILKDMEQVLDNVNLIIMENDYKEIEHKKYIDDVLLKKGFHREYVEAGGWGPSTPCGYEFYEVWERD